MADLGPVYVFATVFTIAAIVLIYAVVESYRHDLMARWRVLLVMLMFVIVLGLMAIYLFYVLAPAPPPPEFAPLP